MSSALTADKLLAIKRPEDLFPGNVIDARKKYRQLAKAWHPDVKGGSTKVFEHLAALYSEAVKRLQAGLWESEGTVEIRLADGGLLVLQIRASVPFSLGQTLICDNSVVYAVAPEHRDLFRRGQAAMKFSYGSSRMEAEFARYLPKPLATHLADDGRYLLQVKKTPDLIRLKDVVTHLGPLDPKHVAWIVSSLLNLGCYFSHSSFVHHDISPENYFISPEFHSGALLGGWWFCRSHHARVDVIPKRTASLMPFSASVTKLAHYRTDAELIKATARECLGKTRAPDAMQRWLEKVTKESAFVLYRQWSEEVLPAAFGKRRFTKMEITADAVYSKGGMHG